MNRVYKVIWSKAKHCYVVTSEIARSVTKSASSARSAGRKGAAVLAMAALLFTTGGMLGEAANVIDVTANKTGNVITVTKDVGEPTTITIDNVDSAKEAVKAYSDGDGHVIKNTYVKIADAKDNLKVDGDGVISKVTGEDGTTTIAVTKLVLNKDGNNQITMDENGIKVGKNSTVIASDGVFAGGDKADAAKAALNADGSIKGANGAFTVDTVGNVASGNVTSTGTVRGATLTDGIAILQNGNLNTTGNVNAHGIVATGNVNAHDIVATGDISGNAITGTSLNTKGGAINGGAITGTSINGTTGTFGSLSTTGNASVGGTLTANSITNNGNATTDTLTVNHNATVGGDLGVTGDITGKSLNVGTGDINGGQITGTGLNVGAGTIKTTGAVETGTLKTTGDATIGGNLSVDKNLTVNGEFNSKTLSSRLDENNYTTINGGKTESKNLKIDVKTHETQVSASTFDETGSNAWAKDDDSIGESSMTADKISQSLSDTGDHPQNKASRELSQNTDNKYEITDSVVEGNQSNVENRTADTTDSQISLKDDSGKVLNKSYITQNLRNIHQGIQNGDNATTVNQTETGIKSTATDGKNTASTNLSNGGFNTYATDGTNKTYTKQTATDIKNTAENGTISNTAKGLVNTASENMTNNVGKNQETTVGGEMKTTVTGKVTEYFKNDLTTTIGRNKSETVVGTSEETVTGKKTENYNGGLETTVTGEEKHTVNGSQTNEITGNQNNTIGGEMKTTVTGKVTEDYKSDLDTKVGGNETHYVKGNQTNTVSGDRTVNVKGTETENFNAQVTNIKTDQTTSVGGKQTNIVAGNQQNTVSGSKTETVKGSVTEKYGSQATTVDGDQRTNVGGNQSNVVKGNQTNTISGNKTETVKGEVTEKYGSLTTEVKGESKLSAANITNSAKEKLSNSAADIENIASKSITDKVGDNVERTMTTEQIQDKVGKTTVTTTDGLTKLTDEDHNHTTEMDYANVTKDLSVERNTTLGKEGEDTNLTVNSKSEFKDTVKMDSTLEVDGESTFNNKVTITKGGLAVTGGTTTDTLNVTGKTETGTLHVNGNGYVDGDLNVKGNIETHDAELSADSRQVVTGRQLYQTNERVDRLDNRIKKVGANAAALAALRPGDFNPDDKFSIAAGFGSYRNASAAALGLFYRPNENVILSLGTSFGDGENMVNAGVSVKFGRGKSMAERRKEMAEEVSVMRDEMKSQNDRIAELEEMLKKQSELIEKLSKES